jgi:uncharacterized protein (TIGR03546 family)
MFWLQIVSGFIKILREGQTPRQIAGGFAFGVFFGLTPMFTLQGVALLLLVLMLDVNLSATILAFTIFGLIGVLLDPVFHSLGYYLLTDVDGLTALWTSLYNAPIAPLSRFNNTLVLGSSVVAVALFAVAYVAMKNFVVVYRSTLGKKLSSNKMYVAVRQSALFRWYEKVRDLGGAL